MAAETTKLADVINPEVMADMISAVIPTKIVATPFARIDDTLQGKPGNTITVPQYAYIGDAEDIAEGVKADTVKLTATSTEATVKKAVKALEITDEAKLSGYGNPEAEAVSQLAKSIASKMDADVMGAITDSSKVQLAFDGSAKAISYEQVVDAIDVFGEEVNSEKVMFVNPAQVTTLRKDANFISADKYGTGVSVMVTGEIGRIANTRVVPTKRIEKTGTTYVCPIVKLTNDAEAEESAPAVTIYMKRGVNLESDRDILAKKDVYSVDQHYTAALTNTAKVVLATFKA